MVRNCFRIHCPVWPTLLLVTYAGPSQDLDPAHVRARAHLLNIQLSSPSSVVKSLIACHQGGDDLLDMDWAGKEGSLAVTCDPPPPPPPPLPIPPSSEWPQCHENWSRWESSGIVDYTLKPPSVFLLLPFCFLIFLFSLFSLLFLFFCFFFVFFSSSCFPCRSCSCFSFPVILVFLLISLIPPLPSSPWDNSTGWLGS